MINKNRNQSNNNKTPAQQKAMEWNGLGAEGFCCHLGPASTSHRLSEDQVPEQPLLRLVGRVLPAGLARGAPADKLLRKEEGGHLPF